MDVDFFGFCIDRMGRAYDEQVWAVALFGAMAGFLVTQAHRLVKVIRYSLLFAGLWATCLLALVFIWSRHFIFLHYDELARLMIDLSTPGSMCSPDRVSPVAKLLAGWSGVSLYSVLVLGMTVVATSVLTGARKEITA